MTITRVSTAFCQYKERNTYRDRAGDALVFLHVLLVLLHLSARVVVDELHAHVLLAAAELRRIDGDEEALDATLLRVLHVLARDLAVAVHVQLEEEDLSGRRGVKDVVERA